MVLNQSSRLREREREIEIEIERKRQKREVESTKREENRDGKIRTAYKELLPLVVIWSGAA